ncbi:hypothetical protein COLO4_20689 [Corchorus olitorius]|uniref:Uncharacterized protein n=1 Tax=Corchorus olitorius TaxID=93759 RepID=A0A1R3IXK2_9ROSI|nr:hypothetical protein COLO4_20689 [Corchorus olitorius]
MSSTDPLNTNMGGWSILQSLANVNTKNSTDNKVYAHPLVKRSSTKLVEKILAMCTESLGNETKSAVGEFDMSLETPVSNNVTKPRESLGRGKMSNNFPSPLTPSFNGVQSVSSTRRLAAS